MNVRHFLKALIEVDPKEARKRIIVAYKRARANQVDAAKILGVAESTLIRYVAILGMHAELASLKRKAQREGWFHDKLTHGGRPLGSKDLRARKKKRAA